MTRPAPKIRRAFYVEPRMLARAKRLLGVKTDAEVVRTSIERVVEMEAFWRFIDRTRGSVKPHSFARE